MDEIFHVDHRTTSVVHETDRISADLLAKAYLHITNAQARLGPHIDSVQRRPRVNDQPHPMQEAQP